ncbi:MAG: hypothetical protein ABEH65_02070 [Halobacteriales archaeon]
MSRESTPESTVSVRLPESISEWLAQTAAAEDLSEEELLRELLATHPLVGDDDVETLADRLDAIESDIEGLDEELDTKIEDVRERVIQVKREADAKAALDHDHPAIEDDLETARQQIESIAEQVDAVEQAVRQIDSRLNAGFENYEDILEYLTDTTDDLDDKLRQLASATLDTREQLRRMAGVNADRAAVDKLATSAQQLGITSAKCESCSESIDIPLLTEPRCPYCAESFSDVEKRRFFRSNLLRTGDPPAIEGQTLGDRPDITELTETDDRPTPDVPTTDTVGGDDTSSTDQTNSKRAGDDDE